MKSYRDIVRRALDSLERAADWLEGMDTADGAGIKRCSDWHDPARWPDMRLPATYNGTNALILLRGSEALNAGRKRRVGTFLSRYQSSDGAFSMPQMKGDEIYKHPDPRRTEEYIRLHISNYARQALDWTAPDLLRPPSFIAPLREEEALRSWFDRRNWNDPWMEGNVIVNVAGLLLELEERALLKRLVEWLNQKQDPSTGFWGNGQQESRKALVHAMAGAMHVYHLYYYLGETIPNSARIIDAGLDIASRELDRPSAACLDVDIVEMLAAMWPARYRRGEIREAMARKVAQVLEMQNGDGGFCDEREGIRRFDGWVGGYWEPQGMSNCFATWFRAITLAIALSLLEPSLLERWTFRDRIGIGYFDPGRLEAA